ncbi:MAG TPA: hypothetical protein VGZ47_23085 [Gemmataceae bacterium]|jgi:hypothetical protein|nr:hypothetical protein [Gemmataceae bacterium]
MSAATVSHAGFLSRLAQNWSDFWFRPKDPTTLGLMRILAGIALIYVHLAYTYDLQNFFGKDGWIDGQLATQWRRENPAYAPTSTWNDFDAMSMTVPQEQTVRHVFLEWLQSLPNNQEARDRKLRFLYDPICVPGETKDARDAYNSLAFCQRLLIVTLDKFPTNYEHFLSTPPEERQKYVNALSHLPNLQKDRDELIPAHWQKQPDAVRQMIREAAEDFVDTLPKEPNQVAMILGHLGSQVVQPMPQRSLRDPASQFQMTTRFIHSDLPDNLAERKEVLDYFDRWTLDPRKADSRGTYLWSVWDHVTNPTAMLVIHFAFLTAMVLFTLGLFTRTTAVISWLALLCYVHRAGYVLFGMDVMMNICMIYLMIAPCGAAYSLDRWLAKRRALAELERLKQTGGDANAIEAFLAGPAPSISANFATRLLQVHFCFIYTASGLAKLKGNAWWNHNALWGTLANPEFSPTIFGPYRWLLVQLSQHRWLWELSMSAGVLFTLMLEISFVFLIWRPRLRPYIVAAAIVFHTGIAIFMGLNVFSLFMMVLLMAWIPPSAVRYWLEVTQGRLFTLRSAAKPALVPVPAPAERPIPVRK